MKLSGPPIELNAPAAQTIGMVIHELATNAAKYGALSNEVGRVFLDWSLHRAGDGLLFAMSWTEHGGPPCRSLPGKGSARRCCCAWRRTLSAPMSLSITIRMGFSGGYAAPPGTH